MGLKEGIDFLCGGHLLSLEHPMASLMNHLLAQLAIVLNLLAEFAHGQVGEQPFPLGLAAALQHAARPVHHLLGDPDELTIFLGLLLLPLRGRHALDLLHAPPRRPGAPPNLYRVAAGICWLRSGPRRVAWCACCSPCFRRTMAKAEA